MKYDTYTSLTAAVADEFYRQSHGGVPSALWLVKDRSVVALCPSWPLPDDALVPVLAAAPLSDWLGPEYDGAEYSRADALGLALNWMLNNGATAIADAEDMVCILDEQQYIAEEQARIEAEQEAAWKLREEGWA